MSSCSAPKAISLGAVVSVVGDADRRADVGAAELGSGEVASLNAKASATRSAFQPTRCLGWWDVAGPRRGGGRDQSTNSRVAISKASDRATVGCADQLGLEQADDRLGHRVVVEVADRPDPGLPRPWRAVRCSGSSGLAAGVGLVHQALDRPSLLLALPDPKPDGWPNVMNVYRRVGPGIGVPYGSAPVSQHRGCLSAARI